jgi:parallel beta-helix repeat protein
MRAPWLVAIAVAAIAVLVPEASAATPICGSVINTSGAVVVFDSDMVCPAGFTGTALTVQANDVTVDGAGFAIVAPGASRAISASGVTGLILRDLNLSGSGSTGVWIGYTTLATISGLNASGTAGTGFYFQETNGIVVTNNTVTGRNAGLFFHYTNSNNTISGNVLTDNVNGIQDYACCSRTNNVFVNNDVSRSSNYGIILHAESNFLLSGNIFTNCGNGLAIGGSQSFILDGLNFSGFGIPGTVLRFDSVSNATISHINASGTGGCGMYFQETNNLTITDNVVTGRGYGLYFHYRNTNNTVTGNMLTDNSWGVFDYNCCQRSGNTFMYNDVSRSSQWGMNLYGEAGLTIGDNTFTGSTNGLAIGASDSIVMSDEDLAAPTIPRIALQLNSVTNSTFTGLDLSGPPDQKEVWGSWGLTLSGCDANAFSGLTVHNRNRAISVGYYSDGNTFSGNDLSGNSVAILSDAAGIHKRNGNHYLNNNLSYSSNTAFILADEHGVVLTGNNFTGSTNALSLSRIDSLVLDGINLSPTSIPRVVLALNGVTNSTFSNMDLSGRAEWREVWGAWGLTLQSADGNVFTNLTIHDRHRGIAVGYYSDNNMFAGNNLSGNSVAISSDAAGLSRTGNRYINNNLSDASNTALILADETAFELAGNDFTGSTNALSLGRMDSIVIDGMDLNAPTIPGTALSLNGVTGSTFTNLDLSGPSELRDAWGSRGLTLSGSDGNQFVNLMIHNRRFAVTVGYYSDANTFSDCDLSDNGQGISSSGSGVLLRTGNRYLRNDLSNCSILGAGFDDEDQIVVDENDFTGSTNGLTLTRGTGALVSGNVIHGVDFDGLKLSGLTAPVVRENTIASSGRDGLLLQDSPSAQVFHNNIHDNARWQVNSNQPIELSHEGEGNYWGRSCPGDLFVAGTDSNRVDVVDSHPYRAADAWTIPEAPGCGPPPISATERSALEALYYATNGAAWTDSAGWLGPIGTECSWHGVTCEMDPTDTHVTAITLPANHLTGSLPLAIADLEHLEMLTLDANEIGGPIPSVLGEMTSLRELRLGQNLFIGMIPFQIGGLANLEVLFLNQNSLEGEIPPEMAGLTQLRSLNLGHNVLTGTIPWQFQNLTGLTGLWLGSNQLTGPIPPELAGLVQLTALDLSANRLTGAIPYRLGELTALVELDLSGNLLEGAIPRELGELSSLTLLSLAGNRLDGTIPPEIGDLVALQHLFLQGNMLEGPVPSTLFQLVALVDHESDFRWNLLFTDDPSLDAFLTAKQCGEDGDWTVTQTMPPKGLTVTEVTTDSIQLTWTAQTPWLDPGRYRVLVSSSAGGPYTLAGTTPDKATLSLTVTGLADDTDYFLVVQTVTDTHANNPNTLESAYSVEVGATTLRLNQPPVALCHDVVVAADGACVALAAIDGGSHDPDGDPILLVQTPDGPYGLGNTLVTLNVTDIHAASASCTATVAAVDRTPPTLVVDARPLFAVDADCSGGESVALPTATAADNCDPDVVISHNAPATFLAGETTTVTFNAVDDAGNTSTVGFDVRVAYGADISIRADRHTVGSGTYPGSTKEPLAGLSICAYDKSDGSCPWTSCGGISHQEYACIVTNCPPVGCCTADATGQCTINVPPGDWVVISDDATKTTLPDPLGVSASGLVCQEVMQKYLQQIVNSKGEKLAAKYTKRTGSELLIIEPEAIVWNEAQELYPFVLDAVGDWAETTTVEPPEGFIRDHDYLSEEAIDEVEALQFTLTDVGTDWVAMTTRHVVRHNGRVEVVLNEIETVLEAGFARGKGLDRWGRPLAELGEGAPPPVRTASAARLEGWEEPSAVRSDWSFVIRAERDTDLRLALESPDGTPLLVLKNGRIQKGVQAFTWRGVDGVGRSLPANDVVIRITSDGVSKVYRLRVPELAPVYDSIGTAAGRKADRKK